MDFRRRIAIPRLSKTAATTFQRITWPRTKKKQGWSKVHLQSRVPGRNVINSSRKLMKSCTTAQSSAMQVLTCTRYKFQAETLRQRTKLQGKSNYYWPKSKDVNLSRDLSDAIPRKACCLSRQANSGNPGPNLIPG